jgi:hypothetical protein
MSEITEFGTIVCNEAKLIKEIKSVNNYEKDILAALLDITTTLRSLITEVSKLSTEISLIKTETGKTKQRKQITAMPKLKEQKNSLSLIASSLNKSSVSQLAFIRYAILSFFLDNGLPDKDIPYPYKWACPILIVILHKHKIISQDEQDSFSDITFIRKKCNDYLIQCHIDDINQSANLTVLKQLIMPILKDLIKPTNKSPLSNLIKDRYFIHLSALRSKTKIEF